MIHVAIVENDPKQAKLTAERCRKYGEENGLSFSVTSFENGYDFLEGEISRFDIIFMDIDRPGINGRETSFKIREKGIKASLIFVTNLPQYAIEGYKVQALDFILKPMTYADFSLARKRARQNLDAEKDEVIALEIHGRFEKFKNSDVLYRERIRHDVYLHLSGKDTISFRSSLHQIEPILNKNVYFKCNSGCIVNLGKVKSMDGDVLLRENGDRISVSRSRKKETKRKLGEYYSTHRL